MGSSLSSDYALGVLVGVLIFFDAVFNLCMWLHYRKKRKMYEKYYNIKK